MSKADEAIITGMDYNPQWMYQPIRNVGEGNKNKLTIDIKPRK
jgi:hypothetical protein